MMGHNPVQTRSACIRPIPRIRHRTTGAAGWTRLLVQLNTAKRNPVTEN